ncbi:tRNA pseudouridine(55) synthase TruB, partial [Candidatus Dependentiae bacterium]|nr:tRNA pseudouridine(55) synthase TruB [Candidatus Dependentiae bacterium]
GFLVVDKPIGYSSFAVVKELKKKLHLNKAGHTGTLDPFASGVLVVALNKATKVIQFLDEGKKEYLVTMELGIETDTLDHTGKVLSEREVGEVSHEDIKEMLSTFSGSIVQIPPIFSAKKIKGRTAYKYAREGKAVELSPINVEIFEIKLIEYIKPYLKVFIRCSKGTYIRSIVRDLGNLLKTGATATDLRRFSSGRFTLEDSISLNDLETSDWNKKIIPLEIALSGFKRLDLLEDFKLKIKNGIPPQGDWFLNKPSEAGKYFVLLKEECFILLNYNKIDFKILRVVEF